MHYIIISQGRAENNGGRKSTFSTLSSLQQWKHYMDYGGPNLNWADTPNILSGTLIMWSNVICNVSDKKLPCLIFISSRKLCLFLLYVVHKDAYAFLWLRYESNLYDVPLEFAFQNAIFIPKPMETWRLAISQF